MDTEHYEGWDPGAPSQGRSLRETDSASRELSDEVDCSAGQGSSQIQSPNSNPIVNYHDYDSSQSSSPTSFHTAASFPGPDTRRSHVNGDQELEASASPLTDTMKYERKLPATPVLNIRTAKAPDEGHQSPAKVPFQDQASPNPFSRRHAASPVSPRSRDRGFSLRRSIMTRTVNGQQQNYSPSTAHSAGSSVIDTLAEQSGRSGDDKKSVQTIPKTSTSKSGAPSFDDLSSLPNYETWLQASRGARSKIQRRLRNLSKAIHKKVLRYQELPPSKNGRHIFLDTNRRKPLIDERRGHEYINNMVISCRYTIYNFLPRQLFAQFSKLANFYFLCVSILQMIPGLSTTGTFTTIVPLLFFVTISMAKEAYDDFRRYRLDKAENSKTATILQPSHTKDSGSQDSSRGTSMNHISTAWMETKWHDIRVGDIVRLGRDDPIPSDIVLLQTHGTEDVAYIETMALDGETNLKSKQPPAFFVQDYETIEDVMDSKACFVAEDPGLDLYSFEGKVTVGNSTTPLTNNEIIYRGSVLRNTRQIYGLVVYTGEECKIRMNATKNPRIKAPMLQTVVNKVVIILVTFVIALAIFNTIAYQVWQEQVEENAWYLINASVAFFPILASFIILFNTMIPLSLYVSLEIVKLCQMFLLNDIEMYDEATDTPLEARTSTINEELGQVSYIFTDKTGTLTNNVMRFRKMSVAGIGWYHDADRQDDAVNKSEQRPSMHKRRSKGKKPISSRTSPCIPDETLEQEGVDLSKPLSRVGNGSEPLNRHLSACIKNPQLCQSTTDLVRFVRTNPYSLLARRTRQFILSITLCHTCLPEKISGGEIEYQAASPDELALIRAAQELGCVLIDRQKGCITLNSSFSNNVSTSVSEVYQVLDVLEFSSSRKRMSVIVRMPNNQICVFCKGADTTVSRLLRLRELALSKSIEVEKRASDRKSLEAQEIIRRKSEAQSRKDSFTRSIHRPSLGGVARPSVTVKRLQPIRDEVDNWLRERESDVVASPVDLGASPSSPRISAHHGLSRHARNSFGARQSFQGDEGGETVEDDFIKDDAAVFERSFQHINDFSAAGLRTLLYGYRYVEEDEYKKWKKFYLEASTSLSSRQESVEKAASMIEKDFEFGGITAIEDKLQDGVPEAIDKLQRAKIKLWMLTGDKRETAVNIGHSCHLIKDYSSITTLDHEIGDVSQRIAAATLQMSNEMVAHSVIVVDGATLSKIMALESLRKLFLALTIMVDTVICCRASPSQKASLVSSIRHKVKGSVTLAIGDGANDIAMIQEAAVGIGITGKEGLQAANSSDYSIAQFRFLTKLLLFHGRSNYLRTCKYTLGTLWKEQTFYLTQALYQRYAGYTGTSLYESWSLSMFNTLFTSLPVIFLGIFEQDLPATTLLAVPELYHSLGHDNQGFNIKVYLAWVAMAASQAVIIFFIMLGIFGQTIFTTDNGLFAMGDLTFTACVIIIATKMQFWEVKNKTITCAISIFISCGGWFLWNIILSSRYHNNVVYDVKDGFFDRFGKNPLWWCTLILVVIACWALEVGVKTTKVACLPSEADLFRELGKDPAIKKRFEKAAVVGLVAGASYDDMEGHTSASGARPVRTAEEEREREGEVEEILKRRQHARVVSGTSHELEPIEAGMQLRQRQPSEPVALSSQEHKVSFATLEREVNDEEEVDDHDKHKTKEKPRRRSTDVQGLLKRGFGSIRRSLDAV